jgi:hypothetical protein
MRVFSDGQPSVALAALALVVLAVVASVMYGALAPDRLNAVRC